MTFRFKCELFCGDLDLHTDKVWKYHIFYCTYVLAEIYNKIDMLLFIEALGITQELFTVGVVLAPNINSCVLIQPQLHMIKRQG